MKNNIKKLASSVGSIQELTKKLIEEGEIETASSDPEVEAELKLIDIGGVELQGMKLAKISEDERVSILEEIKVFKHHIGYAGEHFVVGELLLY